MKQLLFLLLTVPAAFYTTTAQTEAAAAKQSVQHDKDFLLNYYEQTYDKLEQAVSGLNEEQLQFKAAPDKWSISQCLEHIVLSENQIFGYVKQGMEQAPNPERRKELKMTDDDIIKGMTDRSFKAQAPKEMAPDEAGKYKNAGEALEELRRHRQEIINYINNLSVEDMRDRVSDSPFGPVDGYHSFLYIPGHTARHTLQIEEVKADKNFPK